MRSVTACNLCGGTRWKTREETPPFRVAECDCGLVFVTPQPTRTTLAAAYDGAYYEGWRAQARRRERLWARRLVALEALAPARGRLLDVGCGDGAFLRLARARGWDVAGTELSPYAVSAAKADGLAVREGEVWDAGFAAAAFDAVTCWHVLEHTSDPRRVIEEIRRVLRPGGWLMLATPNIQDHI
ncbi:MAG: class I SAM-dependent methyltransferase, partial [Candidatus Rokubacteria bacterium]|nr:class I SAM-dependent methyltransferase [Candidatus Rokubacteria bacterium]